MQKLIDDLEGYVKALVTLFGLIVLAIVVFATNGPVQTQQANQPIVDVLADAGFIVAAITCLLLGLRGILLLCNRKAKPASIPSTGRWQVAHQDHDDDEEEEEE